MLADLLFCKIDAVYPQLVGLSLWGAMSMHCAWRIDEQI